MPLFKTAVALPGKDTEFGRDSEVFSRDLVKLGLRIMSQTTGVLVGTRRKNIEAEWKLAVGFEAGVTITAGLGIIVYPTAFPRAVVVVIAWSTVQIVCSQANTDLTQFEFRRVGGGPGTLDVNYIAVGY